MKLYSKIIIFILIILFVVVLLFLWWRSLRTTSENAGVQSAVDATTSSALQFSDVPRASGGLFSSDADGDLVGVGDGYFEEYEEYEGLNSSLEMGAFAQLTLSKLSDEPAFAHWAVQDTGEVFYMTASGQVFSAEEGDDVEVSSQELPSSLRRTLPSADGRLVLGLFGTDESPRWGMYDTIDGVWRPLSSGIIDATWGMTNETILARREESSLLQFGTIDLRDNTFPFTPLLQDFRLKHVSMNMLSPERVLLVEAPLPGARSRVWELNPKTQGLRLLSGAEEGVLMNVSPKRDFILKYASPDIFQVLDIYLEEQAPVFFLSLPQKCGFDEDNVFCFRPLQDYSDNPTFFDDYMKKRLFTIDILVAFGANNLGEDTLFVSGGPNQSPIDGIEPVFAKGRYTFINRYDGFVYSLSR